MITLVGKLLRPLTPAVLTLATIGCGGAAGSTEQTVAPVQAPAGAETNAAGPAPGATALGVDLDTVRAGRFDNGKMWTFEYPPLDYFRETYGFAPDSGWFQRARLGALRLSNCSASFVSPNGLVLTNHHCARESASEVTRAGEDLLDQGFYAASLSDERPVEGFYADQLIAIVDITSQVDSALAGVTGDAERAQARDQVSETLQDRVAARYGGEDSSVVVETVSLWDGAKYSAYVFHRYTNIKLVLVPELQLGFFGGDPDNFTYPRYALDMSFFRVYDVNGKPLHTDHFFRWAPQGVEPGEPVFVIGNPGSTSRLQTVAELEYRRAVQEKAVLDFVKSRADAMQAYYDANPKEGEALDLRNSIFSLRNSEKAYGGMWAGLNDPVIMARRKDAERQFREAIEQDPALARRYAGLFDRMAEIQRRKTELAASVRAYVALGNPSYTSSVMLRALGAYQYLSAQKGGAPQQALNQITGQLSSVPDQPAELQRRLLAARLKDFERNLAPEITQQILKGRSPEVAAGEIVTQSALGDSSKTAQAVAQGSLSMADPGVQMIAAFLDNYATYRRTLRDLQQQEQEVASALGRARFDVYGTTIPPDATFSLRVADGVVQGYEYNGTEAPPYTTFYGLYDRYYSFGPRSDWELPARWLAPPASFDLSTPLDFVFTSDIIGGNSGSPVLDRDLQLVGVVFDGNIESLPGDYIYLPDKNRAVAVDGRGIMEALDEIYDADRIVLELKTGRLVPTEADADAALVGSK